MSTPKMFLTGAVAGLAGAYVMQKFRTAWNKRHEATPQDGVFGLDQEADLASANMLTNMVLGRTLSERDAEKLALVLHYAYGALAGSVYALALNRFPWADAGYGTLFGTAVWAFGDELPITLSGISDPRKRTVLSHGSAFFVHLLFGATTELSRRGLNSFAQSR